MIKPYAVTILRTIRTVVTVDAESANAALTKVKEYGIDLAITDFPVREETTHQVKITTVTPIKRDE